MAERLQKIIAASGLMSRRAAEQAILDGRVTLNGETAVLGMKADGPEGILVDGTELAAAEEKRYYMLNKPRGFVCSMKDEKGRRSVRELLPPDAGRLYPVGRLDLMSEGLLLMSNDGDFALRVTHPSGEVHKTYLVTVSGEALEEKIRRLREPFVLDGMQVRAVAVNPKRVQENEAVLEIIIREGRNREIRRMCDEAGLRVLRLIRTAEGPLKLGSLPTGAVRQLERREVMAMMGEGS
ncbi:MAG: rRNA pseudouridine synthase [Oscillospiraceae bacterium]|nr:rRNA pseudouridine synthase [Oscillospiraceae bacterium]